MNKFNIDKSVKLNAVQNLALMGFLLGGDNYGEEVIGVSDEIHYNKTIKYFSVTVFLRETESHTSTSGIGFYIKNDNTVMIYSSEEVITVGLTNEMNKLFKMAKERVY